MNAIKSFAGVLKAMTSELNSPISAVFRNQQPKSFEEVDKYVIEVENYLVKNTLTPLPERVMTGEYLAKINNDPAAMEEYVKNANNKYETTTLIDVYRELKASKVFQDMLMTAKNLKEILMTEKNRRHAETHDLEPESLSIKFIANCEGDNFKPFEFSNIDFKQMYYSEALFTDDLRDFLLKCLSIIYNKCNVIVEVHLTPDVDPSELSESIIKIIGKVRKQIPRCDKAFNKIANAVGMLKSNLGEYYKDYVSSQNPSIIIESFVSDVANAESADTEVAAQFAKIIQFFKKKMQTAGNIDPKMQKIMNVLSKQNEKLTKMGDEINNGEFVEFEKTPAEPQIPESQEEREERELSFLPDHLQKKARSKKSSNPSKK
jgi:hypothetical protein